MFLTPAEVTALTGRKTRPAQVKALRAMGIAHTVRPDGSPAVLKSHVEKVLDGDLANAIKEQVEPDWSAMK